MERLDACFSLLGSEREQKKFFTRLLCRSSLSISISTVKDGKELLPGSFDAFSYSGSTQSALSGISGSHTSRGGVDDHAEHFEQCRGSRGAGSED